MALIWCDICVWVCGLGCICLGCGFGAVLGGLVAGFFGFVGFRVLVVDLICY